MLVEGYSCQSRIARAARRSQKHLGYGLAPLKALDSRAAEFDGIAINKRRG